MDKKEKQSFFNDDDIAFILVDRTLIGDVQSILDNNQNYHTNIIKTPAKGLAARAYEAEIPSANGSRVFRRLMLVYKKQTPVAVIDLFVGYPNYKSASIAMCLVHDQHKRKGIASNLLKQQIPRLLAHHHPAVQTLIISITDNNIPALRCLLKNEFQRSNSWQKFDLNGKSITAVTFKYPLKKTV